MSTCRMKKTSFCLKFPVGWSQLKNNANKSEIPKFFRRNDKFKNVIVKALGLDENI